MNMHLGLGPVGGAAHGFLFIGFLERGDAIRHIEDLGCRIVIDQ